MKNNNRTSGLGFSGVLTIVFIVLKLVGVIDWSWWWVVSPILINIGVCLLFVIIYAIYLTHEKKTYSSKVYKKEKRTK